MSICKDGDGITAKVLYEKLLERFSQKDLTPIVQTELSNFSPMVIASTEKAEESIYWIFLGMIKLLNLGCDYIDKDVHCLGCLKEGLAVNPRFRERFHDSQLI